MLHTWRTISRVFFFYWELFWTQKGCPCHISACHLHYNKWSWEGGFLGTWDHIFEVQVRNQHLIIFGFVNLFTHIYFQSITVKQPYNCTLQTSFTEVIGTHKMGLLQKAHNAINRKHRELPWFLKVGFLGEKSGRPRESQEKDHCLLKAHLPLK